MSEQKANRGTRSIAFPGQAPWSGSRAGWCQQVAKAAHGLDDVDIELLADTADEDLDRVGVAIEVLIVEVFDQLGAGYHGTGLVHQIGKQPVFVRGHVDRV